MKVLIKVPLIVDINGRAESFGPMHVLDLPDSTAKSLVQAGHAEIVKRGMEIERAVQVRA
jgi:hypothetical protein